MSKTNPLRVLKKDMVKPGEPRRLDDCAAAEDSVPGGPRARIVEQAGGSAVVEVICTCGRSIHLKCKYAHAGEADQGASAATDR